MQKVYLNLELGPKQPEPYHRQPKVVLRESDDYNSCLTVLFELYERIAGSIRVLLAWLSLPNLCSYRAHIDRLSHLAHTLRRFGEGISGPRYSQRINY